jgi:hypothetical protein
MVGEFDLNRWKRIKPILKESEIEGMKDIIKETKD